jgi:hypothetical protein
MGAILLGRDDQQSAEQQQAARKPHQHPVFEESGQERTISGARTTMMLGTMASQGPMTRERTGPRFGFWRGRHEISPYCASFGRHMLYM